jgi:type II secretory ATPase GspE/PulE/Tfp pilus assembly ATPase PilB-like protein
VSVAEDLYPKIIESLARTGAKFPEFLAKNFARILLRAESLWGTPQAIDYLDSLFLGGLADDKKNRSYRADSTDMSPNASRASRQGFSVEAVKDIVLLKQVHQLGFPAMVFDLHDPFSGSEIVPLESDDKKKVHPTTPLALEVVDEAAAVPPDPVHTVMKRQIVWPIVHTQHDLTEYATRQLKGENIYPMQGKPVGEILMHYGVVDASDLQTVRAIHKRPKYNDLPIGELFVEIGLLKPEELIRTLYVQAGTLMVDLSSIDISAEITKTVPYAKSREKFAVPIGSYQDTLYLAVPAPFTFSEQSFFAVLTGMKICLVYAPKHEIVNRLNLHGLGKKSSGASKEAFRIQASRDMETPQGQSAAVEKFSIDVSENDSIIVNLVNQMILNAIQETASDIHIEMFNDSEESCVRFRRDGNMEDFEDFPRAYHKAVVSRIKVMAGMDISETRRPQDGKISFIAPHGEKVDLRVVTIPSTPGVEFVTIRILASGEPLPLVELGMASRDMEVFREVFQRPYGLILVCGPTGSGKTTTLHSVLKELNTKDRKIWTVEDPIEIVQPHLCQVQVNSKIGMNFAAILRALLRADPDVIMIGEMRDDETAKIALEASMTGHLVLSTLHTNSAAETVSRLLGLDIDPYNLSDALQSVLAQRLARKLCPSCASREEPSDTEINDLAEEYYQSAHARLPTPDERAVIIHEWRERFGVEGKLYFKHPVGCPLCDGGYKGRIGLYELLQVTPALRHLIRQQSAASEYLMQGVADGMRTLKQDGIEKVLLGVTDMIQVRSACI